MTIPNINDPRRFAIEWGRDNRGLSRDEYIDMRADHVTADREQARQVWFHPNFDRDSTTFDAVLHQVRIENDQGRQIRGQITYVDDWFLLDRRAWGI